MITEANLFRVLPETLPGVWQGVFELISPVLEMDGERWDEETLYASIVQGLAQLWVVIDNGYAKMAFVTEFTTYPLKTVCNLWILAGHDLKEVMTLTPTIGQWAVENGADSLQAVCRPGIAKMFKAKGFETIREVIEKKLKH
jgi:hypothetical protein